MTEELVFASYPVFKVRPGHLDDDRDLVAKEVATLFEEFGDRITVRGIYSIAGFKADADIMFWFVGNSADDVQDIVVRLRKTRLGRALEPRESFLGLVRPAEFAKDHLPAFVKGEMPKKYMCVYPYVRTPEWYLLDPEERGRLLREHGLAGREFSDVLANTTSAFGLGDFEWILTFEADSPDRIVELLRRLRSTDARRYTQVEIPFFTGIRKDIRATVEDLP